jgi:hypothetical protein
VEYCVKKSPALLFVIAIAACAPKVTTTTNTGTIQPSAPATEPQRPTNVTGASTARSAVEQFLEAVRAQDLQAMSVIFGTSKGPSRDNMNREELEKRLVILQCYFNHEKFRVLSEFPGDDGHRVIEVELSKQGNLRTPNFYVVPGPSNRWYIDNMEIAAVRDFCRSPGT